jgi:hypothetical protein
MKKTILIALVLLVLVAFVSFLASLDRTPVQEQANSLSAKFDTLGAYEDTPEVLAKRSEAQKNTLDRFEVFHGFTFADRAKESGITFTEKVIPEYFVAQYDHGTGMAVADVDGDGLLDVYFVSQLGGNELWKNIGGGKFTDITAKAGVDMRETVNTGAAFADFNNDGAEDLLVTTYSEQVRLFANNGHGVFRDVTVSAGLGEVRGNPAGVTFFDYDNDGYLDIFLPQVGKFTGEKKSSTGYFYPIDGAFSIYEKEELAQSPYLFQNRGNGTFRDVTKETGLSDTHIKWTGDASFADVNGDGFPDLYIVSMFGNDYYLENQKGKRFVDKTKSVFGRTPWGSMGLKFFDYNNDGLMDLYVVDMHSDMWYDQEVAQEKRKSIPTNEAPGYVQGAYVLGNALYENLGNGTFRETSDSLGLETFWPWGVSVGDVNADGYQDAFVTAGMGIPFRYGINSLLLNNKGETFLDSEFILGVEPRKGGEYSVDWPVDYCVVPVPEGSFCKQATKDREIRGVLSSRSSVVFDIDDDGDLDIVTNEYHAGPQVLVSNLSAVAGIHFLKIILEGTQSNRDGLGARVTVYAGGSEYSQYNDGKSGYFSQSSVPLYFGLGNAVSADKIVVRWPSGVHQTVTTGIPVSGSVTIMEGEDRREK